MRVAGLDGWKDRWVGITLVAGSFESAIVVDDLSTFLDEQPDLTTIAIDIPVQLPKAGRRRADEDARRFVGARRSSVFFAPPKNVLLQATYAEANAFSKREHRSGLSAQSYALRSKILEVQPVKRRMHEVHPEVSFAAMAGEPALEPKKSWAGQRQRISLLSQSGIKLPLRLGEADLAPPDDILDAAAAAWSANRIAIGTARTLPAKPRRAEPAIWY